MPSVLDSAQHVAKLLATCLPSGVPVQSAVGVALSGGPDSTALAYLLQRHATPNPEYGIKTVKALIVDHGLRSSSAQEAKKVSQWARNLGIHCEVQTISWGTPPFPDFPTKTALEASARTARLILFKRFLRQHRLKHIYLAHHLDDQVETAYLRQRRGTASAIALPGLRTFARIPLSLDPGGPDDESLALVRPLLDTKKADLVRFCKEHELKYVVDPTNANPAYTSRNAFRYELGALQTRVSPTESKSGPVHALRQWANRLAKRSAKIEQHVNRLLQKVQQDTPAPGTCTFEPITLRIERPEIRKLFLSQVARQVSPQSSGSGISPANITELDNMIFGYQQASHQSAGSMTPGAGVIFRAKTIEPGRKHWIVSRQPLRASDREETSHSLSIGKWYLWDGRCWCRCRRTDVSASSANIAIKAEGPFALPVVYLERLEESRLQLTSADKDEAFQSQVELHWRSKGSASG